MEKFDIENLEILDRVKYPRAKQIIQAVEANKYFEHIESKKLNIKNDKWFEIVVAHIVCDGVPDHNSNGIDYKEKIAIVIAPEESEVPDVWPLREDFPDLPHMNARPSVMPKSICLYLESAIVINRTWTAQKFLNRIYNWFEKSAKGTLHDIDQPVEQFFFDSKYELILPCDFESKLDQVENGIYISRGEKRDDGGCTFFLGFLKPQSENTSKDNIKDTHFIFFKSSPVIGGRVLSSPSTLNELYKTIPDGLVPFKSTVEEDIKSLVSTQGISKPEGSGFTIFIVQIPITRSEGSTVERNQIQGFLSNESPIEIGLKANLLFEAPNDHKIYVNNTISSEEESVVPEVELLPIEILKSNSKKDYLDQSGKTNTGGKHVLIGLGALGGTLFEVWNRSGWGHWTLIDKDHIKPHNLTRHILDMTYLGTNKAQAFYHRANYSTGNTDQLSSISVDVLDQNDDLKRVLTEADLIIDVTTTLDYPRAASCNDSFSRHCSIFITPNGKDSVLLLEDQDRKVRLRTLEAQYYRAILNSDWGGSHLIGNLGKFISGAGCRDISLRLPFSSVMAHAAIISEQLEILSEDSDPQILVWRKDDTSGAIENIKVCAEEELSYQIGDYQIFFDKGLEKKLLTMRSQNLPSETGGILLGYYDLNLDSIFVVDALPAPNDSFSSQTEFQRGILGTKEDVNRARERTANIVDYIGEWHSHPIDTSTNPSMKDIIQLIELSGILSTDGLPALQIIVGEDEISMVLGESICE